MDLVSFSQRNILVIDIIATTIYEGDLIYLK